MFGFSTFSQTPFSALPQTVFDVSVSEQIAMTDTVIGGYLWNLIDDSQAVNWQNVATSTNPNWTVTDTSAGSGWINVDTI